jgi:hypothetical protein
MKVEKKEGEQVSYNKLKVKQLKTLLGNIVQPSIRIITMFLNSMSTFIFLFLLQTNAA